jgi:hypothetical protein
MVPEWHVMDHLFQEKNQIAPMTQTNAQNSRRSQRAASLSVLRLGGTRRGSSDSAIVTDISAVTLAGAPALTPVYTRLLSTCTRKVNKTLPEFVHRPQQNKAAVKPFNCGALQDRNSPRRRMAAMR